ncbi:MAG: M24 family metallopeptidase [Actinomycetota bacterium]
MIQPTADRAVDPHGLRLGRLARLQRAMAVHGVEVCVLSNEPNVRYATGASVMPVYTMSTFARCAVVPQEGEPVLFEHANSVHRSRLRAPDVRPMHAWEFYDDPAAEAAAWAEETVAAIRELGATGDVVAVDRLGTPAFLALHEHGVRIVDSAPVTQEARRVKTPEEVALFDLNGELVLDMLAAFEDAISPGISERELLAVMADVMVRGGGEYLATTTVCSGPNTNPWRAEATDRRLEREDLVFVDTDTVGIEGCFFCVSRTFPVGEAPSRAQRELYRWAHDWLVAMEALIRPGVTCGELVAEAPAMPERYAAQRYECQFHGIGLEEENPSLCHPDDAQPNPGTLLEESMMLVAELYAGEVGASDGVKLGDQLLVTADGFRVLAPFPFSGPLLA